MNQGPHTIRSTAVYFLEDAKKLLRLKDSTIRREVREGRLRVSRRAGRYMILGEWLLEWIRAGEARRRAPTGLADLSHDRERVQGA